VPTHGHDYRGLLPKKAELAVMPDVVAELRGSAGGQGNLTQTGTASV
jgi:hypothetical protein